MPLCGRGYSEYKLPDYDLHFAIERMRTYMKYYALQLKYRI